MTFRITIDEARKFILLKHGLLDKYKFHGKQGICDFVRQAGCLQYDPIDPHGRNAEIVLQSRVQDFDKQMLWDLLYKDRKLIDHWDKCMSIYPVEDWPHFDQTRKRFVLSNKGKKDIGPIEEEIKQYIRQFGPVNSKDFDFREKVDWWWAPTSLSRAALESMYFNGDLVLHHKKGTIRHYDLAENLISADILSASNPNKTEDEQVAWHLLRRIGAVGLIWNKPSDAWISMKDFKSSVRNKSFKGLQDNHKIQEVFVKNLSEPLYMLSTDNLIMERVLSGEEFEPRTEFIAPLDSFIWDRKLISALFDFNYKWEIYKKPGQREYGYYVLPVLHGTKLVGRIELFRDKKEKQLFIKNYWPERDIVHSVKIQEDIAECVQRFARFNDCKAELLSFNFSKI
ncbi:MAG: hypothetical protein K0R71_1441 [Bacillales bacterium]|jgi:uncharacterized protein YcaQ|nr:hypothetical protein [Bacillales bacterium]